MKFCRVCGTQLPDEAVFCTNCGNTYEQNTVVNADEVIGDIDGDGLIGTTVLGDEEEEPVGGTTVLTDTDDTDGEDGGIGGADIFVDFGGDSDKTDDAGGGTEIETDDNGNSGDAGIQDVGGKVEVVGGIVGGEVTPPAKLTNNEFFDQFASGKTKKIELLFRIIIVVSIFLCLGSVFIGAYVAVIDVIFYVVMAILVFMNKKWVFPLIVTVYSTLSTIFVVMTGGIPGGVIALVFGIIAMTSLKKINKAYKAYKATGQLPSEKI